MFSVADILGKRDASPVDESSILAKTKAPISDSIRHESHAFQKYVEGILENIKINDDDEEQKEHKKKKLTDFSIAKILDIPPTKKQPTPEMKTKRCDNGGHLQFMEILCEIRHRRTKRGDSLEEMTTCKLCGSCSFSQSRAVAANYMAQHLFTHVQTAIYSCGICGAYSSSWKPRVQNHMKNGHPFLDRKQSAKFIRDHRYELDGLLSSLAAQCYGFHA